MNSLPIEEDKAVYEGSNAATKERAGYSGNRGYGEDCT
jgi:hypothetical protein